MTTVAQRLPDLEGLLLEAGRPDLAEQVGTLEIRGPCECSVEGCESFYTGLPMKRWFRRGRQVPAGDYVVDTIDGEIVFVEVLRQSASGSSSAPPGSPSGSGTGEPTGSSSSGR